VKCDTKYKATRMEAAWEWFKAIFWLTLAGFLIGLNHPKFRAMFGLITPRSTEVRGYEHISDKL
jgi:hypothetical protein